MPINVTCPSCHTRFKVSEKFAGRSGSCPKCKGPIEVPKLSDKVVIESAEDRGPKDSKGQLVLKPIERTEAKVAAPVWVVIGGASLVTFAVAFIVGRMSDGGPSATLLGLGAVLLAPPLVFGGYTFLRDDDLEPYRGSTLWLRIGICSLSYAAVWGLFAFIKWRLEMPEFDLPYLVVVFPAMVFIGGMAAAATLDLESTNAGMHYGLYLLITVLLRLTMGIMNF